MLRLAAFLYSLIASTLAAVGAVAMLVAGFVTWPTILAGAIVGAVLAVPVALLVARAMIRS